MKSTQFVPILKRVTQMMKHDFKVFNLRDEYANNIDYQGQQEYFIDGLSDKGNKIDLAFLRNRIDKKEFERLVLDAEYPILSFVSIDGTICPALFYHLGRKDIFAYVYKDEDEICDQQVNELFEKLVPCSDGHIVYSIPLSLHPLVSDSDSLVDKVGGPVSRMFKLLYSEKQDILYLYFYAVIISIISLSLPIGVQAIIELISGGVIFNSIVLLIAFVIVGIMIAGSLQVMQYTIVEILQRRVFVKGALEFTYRMPKIRGETILNFYAPELMNRFFDVLTIQKSMPKILIDITGSFLQIVFGLMLLSFYHPIFIVFSVILIAALALVFWITGPTGLRSSLVESKYKYKVAHWLEELARALNSFKLAGHTNLPLSKTEHLTNNYLHYRKKHFRVLMSQFMNVIAFKTFITGGLLVIGSWLVIERQITLGQFVATEIVIILILAAVEKLILSMSSVYDMLTAVEKIGHVTDLDLEKKGGITMPYHKNTGMDISARGLKFRYPSSSNWALSGVDLDIKPSQRVCIAGYSGSGKNTLAKLFAGLLDSYEGILKFNNLSMRDINFSSLRDNVAKNVSAEDIIDGTVLENVSMGKSRVSYQDVVWALDAVGLSDYVNSLPNGLLTEIVASGKKFPTSVAIKLIIARCIAERPQLFIVNDALHDLEKDDKLKVVNFLFDRKNPWTLMCLFNDPLILSACDKIILLKQGKVVAEGTYKELLKDEHFQHILIDPFNDESGLELPGYE